MVDLVIMIIERLKKLFYRWRKSLNMEGVKSIIGMLEYTRQGKNIGYVRNIMGPQLIYICTTIIAS